MPDLKTTGVRTWTLREALADLRARTRIARSVWHDGSRQSLRLHVAHPEYNLDDGGRLECQTHQVLIGSVHAVRYDTHGDAVNRYELP